MCEINIICFIDRFICVETIDFFKVIYIDLSEVS